MKSSFLSGSMKASSLILSLVFLGACSQNIKKAAISKDADPAVVMDDLESKAKSARDLQADVLAPEDFSKGMEYMKEAREELKEEKSEIEFDEFREAAGYSRAYFVRAQAKADRRKKIVGPIAKARNEAIRAGAMDYESIHESMKEVDEELRSMSSDFKNELETDQYISLQKKYLKLEIKAVQESELGRARMLVKKAEEKGARDKAPKSCDRAWKDLKVAENLIQSNPRAAKEYEKGVDKALESSLYLWDVMTAISKRGGDVKESVAMELVNKNRKLGVKDLRMTALRGRLDQAKGTITEQDFDLMAKRLDLNQAQSRVEFQEAMNEVRKDFSKDEAEVFQQGNNLIIRLKDINFAVGDHKIPAQSKGLLSKVKKIVQKVNPEKIRVEGHTDSTGSSKLNEKLSEKRAKSVANFLKGISLTSDKISTKGFGPAKPLAANSTKEGRALNRRVDIVVTAKQ